MSQQPVRPQPSSLSGCVVGCGVVLVLFMLFVGWSYYQEYAQRRSDAADAALQAERIASAARQADHPPITTKPTPAPTSRPKEPEYIGAKSADLGAFLPDTEGNGSVAALHWMAKAIVASPRINTFEVTYGNAYSDSVYRWRVTYIRDLHRVFEVSLPDGKGIMVDGVTDAQIKDTAKRLVNGPGVIFDFSETGTSSSPWSG